MKDRFLTFLRSTFSEPDGTGSASRVLAGICVATNLIWVSYLVIKNSALPDLSGAALYLSASFSGYAANQMRRCATDKDQQWPSSRETQSPQSLPTKTDIR